MTTETKPDLAKVPEALAELERKYERLVWYARSAPASNVEFWCKVPDHIRQGAFESQMRVEEDYPDEVARLRNHDGSDWQHGFNSGMLAALRFVQTAQHPVELDDEECGGTYWYGGLEDAEDEFPCLHT